MFPFTQKQRIQFLKRFGSNVKINGVDTIAIVEREIINESGQVSETLYITADFDVVQQDFEVILEEQKYRIAYIKNDGTGLVDCYLSSKGHKENAKKYY